MNQAVPNKELQEGLKYIMVPLLERQAHHFCEVEAMRIENPGQHFKHGPDDHTREPLQVDTGFTMKSS